MVVFDSIFPSHWSTVKKLMFLKILKDKEKEKKEEKKNEP